MTACFRQDQLAATGWRAAFTLRANPLVGARGDRARTRGAIAVERGMTVPVLAAGPIARARNGVIGRAGGLPWRLGTDLANFRAVTMGKPVIMGRKTWDSLPRRPLAGRTNVVVSRDPSCVVAGATRCDGFAAAVALGRARAEADGAPEVCVIGGASLFALALAHADRLYLTEVDADVAGDVVLPAIDERAWRELRRTPVAASARDDHAFVIRVLERR